MVFSADRRLLYESERGSKLSKPIQHQGKEGQKLVLQSRCFFFSARPPLFWAFRLLSRERHRVALVVAC